MEVFKQILCGAPVEIPSQILPLARDLIKRLLVVDYTHRLGYGGVEEVMRHPWFQSIDWDALYQCSSQAPLQVQLSREGDTSLYADYHERQEIDPLAEDGMVGGTQSDALWGLTKKPITSCRKTPGKSRVIEYV